MFFCIKGQSKKTMNFHQCELCLHILQISCRSSIRKLTCNLIDCVVYKILNPAGSSAKSTKAVNITSKSSLLQRGEERVDVDGMKVWQEK